MFRNTNPLLAANLQQRCDRLRENGFLVSNSGCSDSQPSRLAPQANSNTTPSDAPLLAVQPRYTPFISGISICCTGSLRSIGFSRSNGFNTRSC